MADAERILDRIRAAGGRVTGPRRQLVTALVDADDHVTAEDLAAAVGEPHLSTVYRTLDALEELGVVDHVHLGHGRAVYHLTDASHQHLVCEACGDVTEVPEGLFTSLARKLQADYGFRMRPNHFAVLGRCAACQSTQSTQSTPA